MWLTVLAGVIISEGIWELEISFRALREAACVIVEIVAHCQVSDGVQIIGGVALPTPSGGTTL